MTNTEHQPKATRPFVVCPVCEGHGTHGPGHVYTQDDLWEQFGYDAPEVMADYRAGRYDVRCEHCNGQRVVRAECEQERHEIADMEAMERAERAFGC